MIISDDVLKQNQQTVRLPKRYQLSERRAKERKASWEKIQKKKVEKIERDQEVLPLYCSQFHISFL